MTNKTENLIQRIGFVLNNIVSESDELNDLQIQMEICTKRLRKLHAKHYGLKQELEDTKEAK